MFRAIKYMVVLAAALAMAGCVKDQHIPGTGTGSSSGEVGVALDIYMPGTIATRALDSDREKSIETIDILSFTVVNGVETYFAHTHGADIKPSGSGANIRAYLRISPLGEQQRIVVLANLRDEIDAKKSGFAGKTKSELLELIKFDTSGAWNVGSSFRPLPMWGESSGTGVVDTSTAGTDFGTIRLMRSVARIDIGLNMGEEDTDYAPQGLTDFRLEDIKIYRTRTEGYAAPREENLDASGNVTHASDEGIVRNTTLPLPYTIDAASPHGLTGTVYVSEASNITRADVSSPWVEASDPLYIIVSGYYKNGGKSWYKIDMRDSSGDIMDVLRNHRYIVSIVSVSGSGYQYEYEAQAAKSANIRTEIAYVTDVDVKYAVFNQYYMLGVSDRNIEAGRLSRQHSLSFTTDYPGDWEYRITGNADHTVSSATPDWIHLNTTGSGQGVGTYQILFTTDDYTGLSYRKAWIHIKSGLLNITVEVVQNTRDVITITLDPDVSDLFFTSGVGDVIENRTINVTWTPTDLPLVITSTGITGYDNVSVSGIDGTYPAGGTATITISPSVMDITDPARVQMLGVDFKVTSNYSQTTRTRTVMLTQRHVGVSAKPTKTYSMTGVLDSLEVYSHDEWIATLVNPDGMGNSIAHLEEDGAIVPSISGVGTGGGEYINFRMLVGDTDNQFGVTRISISSPDNSFAPIEVEISAYWGHSFMSGSQQLFMYASPSLDLQKVSFSGAASYCSGLGSGWRVPSSVELQHLYIRFGSSSELRAEYNLRTDTYLSSTFVDALLYDEYFYLNMANGVPGSNSSSSTQHYIRCVRVP